MIYRQAGLQCGNRHQLVWLDTQKPWGVGTDLCLKGCSEWWRVIAIYGPPMEKKEINTSKTWDAGGLK